jgi:tetratricopeptide (TPR) repeat protein
MIVFASASNYLMEQPLFMLLQSYAIAAVFPFWSTREEEAVIAPHMLRILSIGLWGSIVLICFNQAGAHILFQKAEAAYQRGDIDKALAMLHEVDKELELDEALRPFSYHNAIWNDSLNTDERIERFTSGLQHVPNHPHLHEALGVAFLKKNDTLSALKHFEEAVRNTPRYQAAWLGIAEVFTGQGHWREAFDAILQADATQPTERYKSLGAGLAQDSLTQLAAECPDRKMQLTLEAIRNTPDWSLDILRKTVGNRVDFDHQAYVDACYYMLRYCDEYEDCDLAETMINRYLPNGIEDLNLEDTEE